MKGDKAAHFVWPSPFSLSSHLAVTLIAVYQKHLSPRKGFRCAHRVRHGGHSCSEYIKQAILEHGVLSAVPLARRRFAECKAASAALTVRALAEEEDGDETPDKHRHTVKPLRRSGRSCDSCEEALHCSECGCHGAEILECLPHVDCAALHCGALDCAALDCGALDCGALDCGALDCGILDCASCGW